MVKGHLSMYNETLISTIVKLEGFKEKLINSFCKKKATSLKKVAS